MAGLNIVARDEKGKIKQDYKIYRDPEKGKVVEVDKLKEEMTNKYKEEFYKKYNIGEVVIDFSIDLLDSFY